MYEKVATTEESALDKVQTYALRQALSATTGGYRTPMSTAELLELLRVPDPASTFAHGMKRLFAGDNSPILHDLVAAGVCDFTAIVKGLETWAPEEEQLLRWARGMAAMEDAEKLSR